MKGENWLSRKPQKVLEEIIVKKIKKISQNLAQKKGRQSLQSQEL